MKRSSWDKMATWYDSMVGPEGHKYHKKYAIPVVMDLMNLKKGDLILDVGCGQGALAPYVSKRGGKYYGIDSSKKMIEAAKKRHFNLGKFFKLSAVEIEKLNGEKKIFFDHAVFLLSIQDMDSLEKIFRQVSNKLKSNGKLIIFMLHPAFRIPRQSGWGDDKKRKLIYRRVDRYLSSETIPLNTNVKFKGKRVTSYFYHRPLEKYFKAISRNGMVVDFFKEIAEQKKGYEEFPTFLAIRAIKL